MDLKRKQSSRVTMVDVAKAAGCSQATVSIVLNDVSEIKISSELRDRVLEAARALGYGSTGIFKRPALERMRGGCIGFVVDQLTTTPEAIHAIEGARQAFPEQDLSMLVGQTLGRADQEDILIDRLLTAGVAGIIFMSVFTRQVELGAKLRSLAVPLVLLNCYTGDGAVPAIVPDEVGGAHRATDALLKLGHRRIATITGEMFMEAAQDRLTGYRKALGKADVEAEAAYVAEGNWTPSSGYEATRKLMSLSSPPSAIFCQNDKMAIGCLNALLDLGLKVPSDVSIVGYDDDEMSRHVRPQLTSVDLPHRLMGAWAVERLLRGSSRTGRTPVTKMDCVLVQRLSVAKPAR